VEALDNLLTAIISVKGGSALAVIGGVGLVANRLGWITVKIPSMARRQDDKVIEQLMVIVEKNTAAFVALKSTVEDNKGISIKVSDSLDKVHTALANLSGHISGALQFIEPGHHRRTG
jgi:hypothetical protein